MATILLPPQDCLSSPRHCQNSYFLSSKPEIGRRCFRAVMTPPSAAEERVRHNQSGGLPSGDGLLPIPLMNGQARVLSKQSSSSKSSSTYFPRNFERFRPGASSPTMKPNLSRSTSAILPTPSVGSPPPAEGLLKGRYPFKVVQDNGPGTTNNASALKKSNDVKSTARKRITSTSNGTPNKISSGNFEKVDRLKSMSKHGPILQEKRKDVDVRIRKNLDRSSSGRRTNKKTEMADFPAVTILQRPKTEEAAVELFMKFFQKDTKQGLKRPAEEHMFATMQESDFDHEFIAGEFSDSDASEATSCEGTNSSSFDSLHSFGSMSKGENDEVHTEVDVNAFPSVNAQFSVPVEMGTHLDDELVYSAKDFEFETGHEELAAWERWAGPSFVNSPPPCALPLPRFSKKQLNVVNLSNVHTQNLEDVVPDQLRTPPSSISPFYNNFKRHHDLTINLDAVTTATKDLKRILNLDLCRMCDSGGC